MDNSFMLYLNFKHMSKKILFQNKIFILCIHFESLNNTHYMTPIYIVNYVA